MGNKKIESPPTKGKIGTKGFSWDIYLMAFVITVIIFAIGIFIGLNISSMNISELEKDIDALNEQSLSIQLLSLSESENDLFCSLTNEISDDFESSAWDIGRRIDNMETEKGVYDDDLKKKYSILEFRNYMLSKMSNNKCNDTIDIVLYFYSNEQDKCSDCLEQGVELMDARNELIEKGNKIRIYSFDGDLDSSIVKMLKDKYEVKSYPTIIINGEKYVGLKTTEEIMSLFSS